MSRWHSAVPESCLPKRCFLIPPATPLLRSQRAAGDLRGHDLRRCRSLALDLVPYENNPDKTPAVQPILLSAPMLSLNFVQILVPSREEEGLGAWVWSTALPNQQYESRQRALARAFTLLGLLSFQILCLGYNPTEYDSICQHSYLMTNMCLAGQPFFIQSLSSEMVSDSRCGWKNALFFTPHSSEAETCLLFSTAPAQQDYSS